MQICKRYNYIYILIQLYIHINTINIMVLNMLRQNKIVMLVVMFLVMALAVWLLETFFGYSHLERYTTQAEILCSGNADTNACHSALQKMFNEDK